MQRIFTTSAICLLLSIASIQIAEARSSAVSNAAPQRERVSGARMNSNNRQAPQRSGRSMQSSNNKNSGTIGNRRGGGTSTGSRPGGSSSTTRPGGNSSHQGNSGVRPGGNQGGNSQGNSGYRPGGNSNHQGNQGNKPGNNGFKPGNNKGPGHDNGNHNGNKGPGHDNGNHYGQYKHPGHGPGHNPGHGPGHGPGHWPGISYGCPHHPHMPPVHHYHRPAPPAFIPAGGPVFSTILGIAFGATINVSINALLNRGYDVCGYANDAVYLNNVQQLNMMWPNATLYYDGRGGLTASEFVYSTPYYNMNQYDLAYGRLYDAYGYPVSQQSINGGVTCSWWGGNGYVTLSYQPQNAVNGTLRYYTTLSFGM